MFVYTFGDDYIINRIEIKGPYLSLYSRSRTSRDISDEIDKTLQDTVFPRIRHYIDRFIPRYDWEHDELHHQQLGYDEIHYHIKLHTSHMPETLTDIITTIQTNQHTEQRQKDYLAGLVERINDDYTKSEYLLAVLAVRSWGIFSVFGKILPDGASLSQDVTTQLKSYQETPSQDRCQELISMAYIGLSEQASQSSPDKKETIEKMIAPLKKIMSKLKKSLNNQARLSKIRNLLDQVPVAELSKLVNKRNHTIQIDLNIPQRIKFVQKYINRQIQEKEEREESFATQCYHMGQAIYKAIGLYFSTQKNHNPQRLRNTPSFCESKVGNHRYHLRPRRQST